MFEFACQMMHRQTVLELQDQRFQIGVGDDGRADVCSVEETVDVRCEVRDQHEAFAEES